MGGLKPESHFWDDTIPVDCLGVWQLLSGVVRGVIRSNELEGVALLHAEESGKAR